MAGMMFGKKMGGKMAPPFGGKEKGKEEMMEKKMGKKAYMAGEAKEKKAGVSKMGMYSKGGMTKKK